MLSSKKLLFERFLDPVVGLFKNVNPNILTLIGSIPSILFFVFVINHLYALAIIAFLGTIFDILDGMIARKYNKITIFGGFLDSTLDRISDFLIIIAFGFGGIVRWEIVTVLLFLSFLISYVRSRGEQLKTSVSFAVGVIERPERLILIFVSLILYLIFPNLIIVSFNIAEVMFIVLSVISFYTIYQRVVHAYKELRR